MKAEYALKVELSWVLKLSTRRAAKAPWAFKSPAVMG